MQRREIPLITDLATKSTGDWSVNFNFNGCVVWFFKNIGYTVTRIDVNSSKGYAKISLMNNSTGEQSDMTFKIRDFVMGFTSLMENCLKSIIES